MSSASARCKSHVDDTKFEKPSDGFTDVCRHFEKDHYITHTVEAEYVSALVQDEMFEVLFVFCPSITCLNWESYGNVHFCFSSFAFLSVAYPVRY